jgi:hypothetical protein
MTRITKQRLRADVDDPGEPEPEPDAKFTRGRAGRRGVCKICRPSPSQPAGEEPEICADHLLQICRRYPLGIGDPAQIVRQRIICGSVLAQWGLGVLERRMLRRLQARNVRRRLAC